MGGIKAIRIICFVFVRSECLISRPVLCSFIGLKQLCLLRKWKLIFLNFGLIAWGGGGGGRAFDYQSRNGGGAFANKNCPPDRVLHHFFKCPGFARGGMLAAGIDSHINSISCRYLFEQVTFSCKPEHNRQMQYVGGARG